MGRNWNWRPITIAIPRPATRAGLTNRRHACPKWHAERFAWQAAFTAAPFLSLFFFFFFLISFARPASLYCEQYVYTYTNIWLRRHFLFININQFHALNFIRSFFQASTCFEHMCSSSGGQKLYYTVSSIITPIGGRPVHGMKSRKISSSCMLC